MTDADVLLTVRRAYRYLVAYERRVLDAIAATDEVLREYGYERKLPHRWAPLYTDFPSRAWAPEKWAWTNVPTYACRYQWFTGQANQPGNRWVLVDHLADTGFEEERLGGTHEPDPLAGLEDLPNSRSIIRWLFVHLSDSLPDATYNRSWNDLLARHFATSLLELLPRAPTSEPVQRLASPATLSVHCVDLATLTKEASLGERFLDPLRKMLDDTERGGLLGPRGLLNPALFPAVVPTLIPAAA